MDLLKLFNPNEKLERVHFGPKKEYPEASNDSSTKAVYAWNSTSESGTDYVKKYLEEEDAKALQTAKLSFQMGGGAMDEVSVGTLPTTADVDNEELTKVYNNYEFEYRPKEDLSIFKNKSDIVSTIQTHSVTVIEGVTGCGKSTQVPQFILDSCKEQRKHCNIVVTQPRRIAALSIASRVCKERDWQLGSIVGVQVGMYRNISPDTRLCYCTTGVLLRKLISAKNLLEYTHIVLDEVHERDQEMDFLLLIIRKLLRTNSRQVKIVLMSATFNVNKFSTYFSTPTEKGFIPAPIISIPKKRNFQVHKYYLDQLNTVGSLPDINAQEPRITDKMMTLCINLINIFDDIDTKSEYDAEELAEYDGEKPFHSVLVFLPGIWEIEEMHNLMVLADKKSDKWDIVVLHSSITGEEQNKIFLRPPKGKRRVILATNLAESSITINDVKFVIDFCLTKQLVTDINTNFQCLELTWASKANCEQRAGRAGRVMDGRVYRLVPKDFYEHYLLDEGLPEIKRAPLENLVLQTKLLDMGEPRAVLALAIDPPDLSNLQRTILLLKEAGGLVNKPNATNTWDGDLTDLGRIMAALPIDIHLSKLIALGHVFNVFRDTVIMAAAMANKSMFNNPFQKRMEAYEAKIHWADGSSSDCMAMLNAYTVWYKEINFGHLKKKSSNERSWAKRNFIQIKVLHEIDYLIHELTLRLERLGIKETSGPNKITMNDMDRFLILKVVIAGAFYPNYFIRNNSARIDDQTGGAKALGGLDPTRTVSLTGWRPDLPGKLYSKRIQEKFKPITMLYPQIVVEFDGSSRIFIMFPDEKNYGNEKKQSGIPGKISLLIYKALKMRKLQSELAIEVMDLKSSIKLAEEKNIPKNSATSFYTDESLESLRSKLPTTVPCLPPINVTEIPIEIVNFNNPNKFWVHHLDKKTHENLKTIETFLNDHKNITLTPVKETPPIGSLVATRGRQGKMCRVVIESYSKVKDEDVSQVHYIDYGYRGPVRVVDLKTIMKTHAIFKMPALAIECTLTNVEPSTIKDPDGCWTEEAKRFFMRVIMESERVIGTIYSVTDSVMSLEVNCLMNEKFESLNELLVEEEFAAKVEESYLSRYNHKIRSLAKTKALKELAHREYLEYLQYDRNFLIQSYPEPPPIEECGSALYLKGPFSPLEVTFSSLAIHTGSKKVNIETQSVNSIVLDMDPDDLHERLLVSSNVSQSVNGNCLTLRNTTLLPNLPGLTTLICLLFAPKIELRRSVSGSHYIGALCGLGYNTKTDIPLMAEHDMDIHFDTEITIQDMQIINRMRHYINLGICVKSDEIDDWHEQAITCQTRLFKFFKDWSGIKKKSQKVEQILNSNKWGLYDDSLFLVPKDKAIKEDSIYPLHNALQLEEHNEELEDLEDHIAELRGLSVSDVRLSENIEVECKLCNEIILRRESLRIHLFSDEHRDRERELGIRK